MLYFIEKLSAKISWVSLSRVPRTCLAALHHWARHTYSST